MEKKNIDWGNLSFGYVQTDYRFVANYKDGAWEEGGLTTDANITMSMNAALHGLPDGEKTEEGWVVLHQADIDRLIYGKETEEVKEEEEQA